MRKLYITFLIISLIFCISPVSFAKNNKSDIEKREKQISYYNNTDKQQVMKAAAAVLHDSGFRVDDVDYDLGLLIAQKSFKESFTSKKRVLGWGSVVAATAAYSVFSYGSTAGLMIDPTRRVSYELRDKTVVVTANVNIDNVGDNQTRVRLSMMGKVLQNADGYSFMQSAPIKILHPNSDKMYTEFFTQISKNLNCED